MEQLIEHLFSWSKLLNETIPVIAVIQKGNERVFHLIINVNDSIFNRLVFLRTFIESLTINSSIFKKTIKILNEIIIIYSNIFKKVSRIFLETINILDTILKKKLINLLESININESFIKTLSRVFSEILSISINFIKLPVKIFKESITLVETSTHKIIAKVFREVISSI